MKMEQDRVDFPGCPKIFGLDLFVIVPDNVIIAKAWGFVKTNEGSKPGMSEAKMVFVFEKNLILPFHPFFHLKKQIKWTSSQEILRFERQNIPGMIEFTHCQKT